MLVTEHKNCRVCDSELIPIISLGEHYLHGSFDFPDFHPPARKIECAILKCSKCHLVQQKYSIDPDILYARYGYRSSTNETMRNHLTAIVDETKSFWYSHSNEHPKVLGIGENDGFAIKQYHADSKKVAIDPCDIGKTIKDVPNFRFINSTYPIQGRPTDYFGKFDIISMIACLYDCEYPMNVVKNLKYDLSNNGLIVIEVAYWPKKMENNGIDDLCNEHVAFYSYQNLEYLIKNNGLKIFNAKQNSINGGSIQLWICHENICIYDKPEYKQNILNIKFYEFNCKLEDINTHYSFYERIARIREKTLKFFKKIKENKKTVQLLGASTKANVMIGYLGLDNNDIPYASERSPEKWGGQTLGTNIKMISEEESRKMRPDYYLVGIWAFKDEVIKREKDYILGGGKLIFVLPELEIIDKSYFSDKE